MRLVVVYPLIFIRYLISLVSNTTHYQNFILWLRHLNFKGENASISSLRNNLWIRILVKIAVVCLSDLQVTPFTNGRHRSPEQLCLSISILVMLNKRETILFYFYYATSFISFMFKLQPKSSSLILLANPS